MKVKAIRLSKVVKGLPISVRDGFLLTLINAPSGTIPRLAKRLSVCGWARTKTGKALLIINLLRKICEKNRCLELPYMKNILENTNEDGYYQTFQFKLCIANQLTGFYMIGPLVVKRLNIMTGCNDSYLQCI